ncbi:MAG: NADH:ubiquinone reductase (Na(+)-transporting) subunit B [Flavobacteriales bacterium]|nr:NADH:ubiquinone reductase (Na(+)-transporting) subunit B [Flavobacteriales bacterium]
MSFMRKILDSIKPHFTEGKLKKMYPAYDAFETFLFVPNHTSSTSCHVRDSVDLKRTMGTVILALVPCLLFGCYNIGYQYYTQLGGELPSIFSLFTYGLIRVLPMIVVSYVVGLSIEFGFAVSRKHQVNEGYLVTGMLIPLIFPIDCPLWIVAISVAFAVVIGKEVFGGTGMNILNPALLARAFAFFAYPTKLSGDKVWVSQASNVDGVSGETALGQLATLVKDKSSEASDVLSSNFGIMDSFLGFIPGSIGETSVLAILIGAAILIFTGIGSWRIIFSGILGGFIMALIFNLWNANGFMGLNPFHQLFIGGFMFGIVFMATDPVSAAQTNKGKYIYGFLCGFLAIMIRVFNPAYPEGIMLAVLFMNVMAPMIDHYVIQSSVKRRLNRIKDGI